MNLDQLQQRWYSLNEKYTEDTTRVAKTWQRIAERYTHKSRYYHTLEHLTAMFALLDEYHEQITDPDLLDYCVWFHDIVYKSLKKNNERKSAEEAQAYLKGMGYPEEKTKHVAWLIIKTKNHMEMDIKESPDDQLFLDSDLAILGRSKETYIQYMQQVRKEYYWVPDVLYNSGRKGILQKMLEAENIYRTAPFRERFEQQARENLQMEIGML